MHQLVRDALLAATNAALQRETLSVHDRKLCLDALAFVGAYEVAVLTVGGLWLYGSVIRGLVQKQ